MYKRYRWCIRSGLVLLLLLLGLQSVPAAPPEPRLDPSAFWGMVVRDPLYEWNTNPAYPNTVNQAFIESMLDHLQLAGVRWVRFEFHATWDGSDWGSINLAQADYFIAAAHARGINVLALIGTDILKGPQARVSRLDGATVSGEIPAGGPDSTYCAAAPIGCGVNVYMEQWLLRAISIANYYQGRIQGYELLNEENFYFALWDETSSTPKPQDEINPLHVARLITKFFRILRTQATADTTPIILGGLQPRTSRESGRTDRQYLAAIYASEPFAGYRNLNGRWPIDGIGYHPYPVEMVSRLNDNDFLHLVGPRLDALITTIRNAGDTNAKLWLTEAGTRGDPNDPNDLIRQQAFLHILTDIVRLRQANIATFFWFKYEDFPPASEAWGVVHIPYNGAGSYDVDGTVSLFKPVYWEYACLARSLCTRLFLPQTLNDL